MKLTIPGSLTDLNTYINAERTHRYKGAKIKKEETALVATYARSLPKVEKYPVQVHFHWYCKNKRKDIDNIIFSQKFVLDGLVDAGVLENDGWKQISGITHSLSVDKSNPRVEVVIE